MIVWPSGKLQQEGVHHTCTNGDVASTALDNGASAVLVKSMVTDGAYTTSSVASSDIATAALVYPAVRHIDAVTALKAVLIPCDVGVTMMDEDGGGADDAASVDRRRCLVVITNMYCTANNSIGNQSQALIKIE